MFIFCSFIATKIVFKVNKCMYIILQFYYIIYFCLQLLINVTINTDIL